MYKKAVLLSGVLSLLIPLLLVSMSVYRENGLPVYLASQSSCEPTVNIGFLKTHKCASSTVQNILMRFGLVRNLSFVLPRGGNYFGKEVPFHHKMAADTPWHSQGYNIFAVHTKWDHDEVAKIMPPDTKYITILRNPVDLFESLYSYYNLKQSLKMDIKEFALGNKSALKNRFYGFLGRNQMLWDLGMPLETIDNPREVEGMIKMTEANFDLVMIAEQFDESLILLKDIFCWNMTDITSLKVNARKNAFKSELSPDVRSQLETWLQGDMLLYDHFSKLFEEKLVKYGLARMREDAEDLRDLNKKIFDHCLTKEIASTSDLDKQFKTFSSKVLGFRVSGNFSDCVNYAKTELPFLGELRELQKRKVSVKISKSKGQT